MFPGARREGLEARTPIFITTNSTITVPSDARYMHAFILSGGGSGGVGVHSNQPGAGGGGGAGGYLFLRVDLDKFQGNLGKGVRPSTVDLTIGSGGAAVSANDLSFTNGNAGGSTQLVMSGGLNITVLGGGGGTAYSWVGTASGGGGGASDVSFTASRFSPLDYVIARPFMAVPSSASDTWSGSGPNGGNATVSGAAHLTGLIAPWWLQTFSLTPGSPGTGSGPTATKSRAGGGGGAGWGGNGGNAATTDSAVGVTASAGTGYGSGGGGAGGGGTSTSGAGTSGCAVIMFECEV